MLSEYDIQETICFSGRSRVPHTARHCLFSSSHTVLTPSHWVIQVIRAVSPEHDPVVIKITEDAALWENERQWLKAYKKKNAELQWPTNGGHIVTLIGSFQEGGRCKKTLFSSPTQPYLMLLPPTLRSTLLPAAGAWWSEPCRTVCDRGSPGFRDAVDGGPQCR